MKNNNILYTTLVILSTLNCTLSSNSEMLLPDHEIYLRAHKYTNWFYSNNLDSLSRCIVDKKFTIHDLREFREKVDEQIGKELKVINERISKGKSRSFFFFYSRNSKFEKIKQPVRTIFSFDNNNNIFQFSVETLPVEAPTKYMNYKTKTKLRLPFDGEWYVSWGGRKINYNQHAVANDQRFAYDFLIKRNGFTYKNDGKRNEDYYCYNEKIFAPGSGTIVEVLNKVKENIPGQMPKISGNHVIIDHGNGEFSILSHLKCGSIVVQTGQDVNIGQYLGLCGNSGHSSEPHLHYHLQNTPILFKGDGLPAQFESFIADGIEIEHGEPFWDQKVSNFK